MTRTVSLSGGLIRGSNKMRKDPIISLFGSMIHPEFWMRLYNSLSSNKVPFELIFVGNKIPNFKLPENCHFIYSETKPAQCYEIGSRYAVGDLIMHTGDDCVFSERALDNIYEIFRNLNDDKAMVSCGYILGGNDLSVEQGYYWTDDNNSPRMPFGALMKREMWKKLGGIDNRFIAQYWDLDIAMRMYEIGGRLVFAENAWVEEVQSSAAIFWKKKFSILNNPLVYKISSYFYHNLSRGIQFFKKHKKRPRLWLEFGVTKDRPILDQFWVIKKDSAEGIALESIYCHKEGRGAISKRRLAPIEPFEDRHILTVSQGPKGRWK